MRRPSRAVLGGRTTIRPSNSRMPNIRCVLTTGRRLESYNTGVQTSGYVSPLHFGETLDISPEDAAPARHRRWRDRSNHSRRGRVLAPARIDPRCVAGIVFMTLHFPDDVATNPDDRRVRSEVRHGGVQGVRRTCGVRGTLWRRLTGLRVRPIWTSASIDADATAEERAAVDGLLGPPARRGTAVRAAIRVTRTSRPSADVRRARAPSAPAGVSCAAGRVGWISEGGLGYICERLNVPPADAWGVATFYALLRRRRNPKRVVHVCDDIACKCGARTRSSPRWKPWSPALHGRAGAMWKLIAMSWQVRAAPAASPDGRGWTSARKAHRHITAIHVRALLTSGADSCRDAHPARCRRLDAAPAPTRRPRGSVQPRRVPRRRRLSRRSTRRARSDPRR